MWDLAINLLASAIAASAVWMSGFVLRRRTLQRKRRFFGFEGGGTCVMVVARHSASPRSASVHRNDMAALLELAVAARDCGSTPVLAMHDEPIAELGRRTEFVVGGPGSNARMARHLARLLPGMRVEYEEFAMMTIHIGSHAFVREPEVEYVALARVLPPDAGRPVFILCGQTAGTNHAAARYLTSHYRELERAYGADKPFCIVLRVVEPAAYGGGLVAVAGEHSDEAMKDPRAV